MPNGCPLFIGASKCLLEVVNKIGLFASCDATLLISGETGTGKDLYARAIHYRSPRRCGPFVPVNCAALPEQLVESELFGHVRGAFTDAACDRKGLIEEAERGTLFLDEINSLSLSAQGKLLRFLQDREYRRLGSNKPRTGDIRVIAASNTDLRCLVRERRFREDLFHRLNMLSVFLPPLRERMEDVPLLADHFLTSLGIKYGRSNLEFTETAKARLMTYDWPGNVRELQGVIERGVILSTSPQLEIDEIPLAVVKHDASTDRSADYCATSITWNGVAFADAKCEVTEQFERGYLVRLLAQYSGNITRAAKAAGTGRRSLQRLLRRHHLDRSAFLRSA